MQAAHVLLATGLTVIELSMFALLFGFQRLLRSLIYNLKTQIHFSWFFFICVCFVKGSLLVLFYQKILV